jgi:hypothetical protein
VKRFLALFLSGIFLSSVLVGLLPASYARAASVYDDVIRQTDSLSIKSADGLCDEIDYSTTWVSDLVMNDTFSYTNREAMQTLFDNKIEWGVSQYINASTGQKNLEIFWSEKEFSAALWETYSGSNHRLRLQYNSGGGYTARISVIQADATCVPTISGTGYSTSAYWHTVSDDVVNGWWIGFFTTVDPIPLPSGYAGEVIPDSFIIAPTLSPEIGYSLYDDLRITALSLALNGFCIPVGLTETTGCATNYQLHYVMYDSLDVVIDDQYLEEYEVYEYKFAGVDTYYFEVSYASPPPPGLPLSPGAQYKTVRFQLDVDGLFKDGGTGLETCVDDGLQVNCDGATPLADCSTFGTDVGGYFQCVMTNFGIQMQSWLRDLFMPRHSFFNGWSSNLGDFLNSKLGFVATSFAFVASLFGGIIEGAATTSCTIAPPGTLFGQPFSINVCQFATIIGSTPWGVMQGLIVSLTVLALIFAGYRKYLEVVNHR